MTPRRLMSACLLLIVLIAAPAAGQFDYGLSGESWPAFLRPQRIAVLSAEVDGVVRAVNAEPQAFVAEGEALVELDSTLVQLQIEQIETQVRMSTSIEEAETALQFAEDNLEIVTRLYETEVGEARVGSPKEYREATQRRDMARYALQKAHMEQALLDVQLRHSRALLRRHTVRAPIDGVIVTFASLNLPNYDTIKLVVAGEMVRSGQAVLAIMKVDRLRVSDSLSLADLARVRLGQSATVYIEGGGDEGIPAEIVYISPTIDSTGEFTIQVEFDNPPAGQAERDAGGYRYRFRPGLRARVELGS